jgi:hypothetical protein
MNRLGIMCNMQGNSVRTRTGVGDGVKEMVRKWGCEWPCKGPYRDEKQHKFRTQVAMKGAIMFQLCILARKLCSFFLGVNDRYPRLLKTRPSSVFMLLGWKEISTIS